MMPPMGPTAPMNQPPQPPSWPTSPPSPQSMNIAQAFMGSHHATQPLLRQSVSAANGGAIPALPNTPGEMSSFAKTPAGQALVNRIMEQIHKSAASQAAIRAKKFDKLGTGAAQR